MLTWVVLGLVVVGISLVVLATLSLAVALFRLGATIPDPISYIDLEDEDL